MRSRPLRKWALYGLLLLAGLVLPFATGRLATQLMTTYLIFSLVAVGFDLIFGYTGILSLGQFAFFGIGAYSAALGLTRFADAGPVTLPLIFLAAVGLPALVGLVTAYVFFSAKLDELFVLVTIALALVAEKYALSQTALLGGVNGMILPYWVVPTNPTAFFYVVLAIVAVVYAICRWIVAAPFGKVLLAIKESEQRTRYLGYNTTAYKVTIYALAAAISGLSGALYAIARGFVAPTFLGFNLSFDAVVWAAIGGLGTIYGPILGTLAVSWAKFYLSGVLLEFWVLVVGALFIVAVLFFPEGFAGIGRRLGARRTVAAQRRGKDVITNEEGVCDAQVRDQ